MNIPVEECSSCGACANVCANNAISMELDKEGFYRPTIDTSKCIKCGLCERTCPWTNIVTNPNLASSTPQTIAAFAKDESIRLESSSGGIFTILAEKILDDGGVVVGVAQTAPTRFGHIVVDNKTDLKKLRGSKYVQADVGFVYREIRTHLKSGRKVLFSGTPCQVAALYAVLGSKANTPNLYTVDIVCHGTPSVKVFEKYVEEIEQKQQDSLQKIFFRDKRKGWNTYSLTHLFKSGKTISVRNTKSLFMSLMLNNIFSNKSCANCHYRKLPRIADITLGDYWGIIMHHPQMDDNKGTSVILINTEHGKTFFDSVSNDINQCESKLDYAIAGNPCIVQTPPSHPKRDEFFEFLDKYSLEQLAQKYKINQPFYKTLLSTIVITLWDLYQKTLRRKTFTQKSK
ncbi:Coenzyme F420 hydrogenase/dehydrogenase, beta subunit C-terminal domain [Fibrobacter sp. UWB12]|uniref:Coenzyme F420 hydrogenase/dehydrogenase, beta subunit C-terminal domain n=1 Tax=Fibrobacter sp. UWB12 TaxID=1896203 RepID=UPI000920A5D6|nr:Coenzyme F420 hydrogenase/dehydrogenase, beta subunit C-terminal domain [Fibrobacter sp. UWB12]SHK89511.1 Coenzyme F420-reducing hydrogenase, beta subunit [Fibrobacter sp. UWB12]